MASSSNSSMMSTIDSLKDKMSDEVYLELCNKMKELHNQQDSSLEVKPYAIWFFEAKGWTEPVSTDDDDDDDDDDGKNVRCAYFYDVFPKKHIVMMTREKANTIKLNIQRTINHCSPFSFDTPFMRGFYNQPDIGKHEKINRDVVMCYRIEPMDHTFGDDLHRSA